MRLEIAGHGGEINSEIRSARRAKEVKILKRNPSLLGLTPEAKAMGHLRHEDVHTIIGNEPIENKS